MVVEMRMMVVEVTGVVCLSWKRLLRRPSLPRERAVRPFLWAVGGSVMLWQSLTASTDPETSRDADRVMW